MKTIKEKTIETMSTILKEYQNENHICSIRNCSLCELFYSNSCNNCPMGIFKGNIISGCLNRKCYGASSSAMSRYEKDRVIDFYTKAIRLANKYEDIRPYNDNGNLTKFSKALKALDRKVYKKFKGLKRQYFDKGTGIS